MKLTAVRVFYLLSLVLPFIAALPLKVLNILFSRNYYRWLTFKLFKDVDGAVHSHGLREAASDWTHHVNEREAVSDAGLGTYVDKRQLDPVDISGGQVRARDQPISAAHSGGGA